MSIDRNLGSQVALTGTCGDTGEVGAGVSQIFAGR
jgi:hypothetical protein